MTPSCALCHSPLGLMPPLGSHSWPLSQETTVTELDTEQGAPDPLRRSPGGLIRACPEMDAPKSALQGGLPTAVSTA